MATLAISEQSKGTLLNIFTPTDNFNGEVIFTLINILIVLFCQVFYLFYP